MGNVYAEITVKNAADIVFAKAGQIAESDIRTVTLTAVVDTGATTLVITEDILKKLGVGVVDTKYINLAGGGKTECKITDPVHIQWKDRFASVNAVVLPGGKPLLGVIPLEFMDLIVDPVRRELVGANGEKAELMAM